MVVRNVDWTLGYAYASTPRLATRAGYTRARRSLGADPSIGVVAFAAAPLMLEQRAPCQRCDSLVQTVGQHGARGVQIGEGAAVFFQLHAAGLEPLDEHVEHRGARA